MPNIWFTADFHLGHKNIIRYCNRPFDSVEAMNCAILERLNTAVKANDVLYFLGDFCIGPKARAVDLRSEIRCKKIFAVPGNHDKDTRKLTQEFFWLGDLAEVSINGQRMVLCHYAMRVWNHSSHGAWHLYGHSHGRTGKEKLAPRARFELATLRLTAAGENHKVVALASLTNFRSCLNWPIGQPMVRFGAERSRSIEKRSAVELANWPTVPI